MITQCPIRPGQNYTYKFNITGQEGTLWWHVHISFLRETVHGALIIRPKEGKKGYPFPIPNKEVSIILGEWWNLDAVKVDEHAFLTGGPTRAADALTINGETGDLYSCSGRQTYKLEVERGKTYLLRISNAAINNQFFFKIAGHSFTVVGVDACYTNPYKSDVIVIALGQTVDALMVAHALPRRYYMAASVYETANPPAPIFVNTTTTGIVKYVSGEPLSHPVMPDLPAFHDVATAKHFVSSLTGLLRPGQPTIPLHVDKHMFVTVGLGYADCLPSQVLCKQGSRSLAASMNNVSFLFPTKMSLLEAYLIRTVPALPDWSLTSSLARHTQSRLLANKPGTPRWRVKHSSDASEVYTRDFPSKPSLFFDFTNISVNTEPSLAALRHTVKGTSVKKLRYNTTVEMVLQNTAIIGIESHPMHIHGHNFYVLAQGLGNYDKATAAKSFNLANPLQRSTIAVPTGGWAVIRFTANNPGVWLMQCHIDTHLRLGLATAFEVENGLTTDAILPPAPPDFPEC